jgi:hypothetical protein
LFWFDSFNLIWLHNLNVFWWPVGLSQPYFCFRCCFSFGWSKRVKLWPIALLKLFLVLQPIHCKISNAETLIFCLFWATISFDLINFLKHASLQNYW